MVSLNMMLGRRATRPHPHFHTLPQSCQAPQPPVSQRSAEA